mgnify:CR=1 FL=1
MTIQEMLTELVALGYSQRAIADECRSSQPNIHRAMNGAEPRYSLGKAIEALHRKAKAALAKERRAQLAPDDRRGRRTTDPTGNEIQTLRECAEQAKAVADRLAG